MKHRYLCSTKWWFFLSELPLAVWFALALYNNRFAEGVLRYYPMLVAVAALMVVDFLFFFRLVKFSYDEIRTVGRFSTRDRVILAKGKTLVFTLRTHRMIGIDVYGHDGEVAALEWLRDTEPTDIRQLHTRAVGGAGTVQKLLAFYHVEGYDASTLLSPAAEPYHITIPTGELTAETVNERRVIRLTFAVSFDTLGAVLEDDDSNDSTHSSHD